MIGSILVSLLILSKNMLEVSLYLFGNTSVFKYIFVALGIYVIVRHQIKIYRRDILLFSIIGLFFLLTYFFNNNNKLSEIFGNFIAYGLAGFSYSFCKTDERRVINYCIVGGTAWLILYVLKNGSTIYNTFSFGYLMLPVAICCFIKTFEREDRPVTRFIAVALFLITSYGLVINGSRGPVACYILFILLYLFPLINNTKKKLLFYSAFVLIFVLLLNYKEIIYQLHQAYPGKISFIDKSYLLLSVRSDVTNGRLGIVDSIINEYTYWDFIFGIGIGTYESTHLIEGYTHNLLISLILDYGIIGIILFIKPNIVFFKSILERHNNYLILLYSVSVIHLMFSGTYWESFEFWLFMFTMTKITFKSKSETNCESSILSTSL